MNVCMENNSNNHKLIWKYVRKISIKLKERKLTGTFDFGFLNDVR